MTPPSASAVPSSSNPADLAAGPRNLLLVKNERQGTPADFEQIARLVRQREPRVRPRVIQDRRYPFKRLLWARRPTMVFSPSPLRRFRPLRGRVFEGEREGSKLGELERLEAAGNPVPRWTLLTRDYTPDLSAFGPYVVVKPNRGGRGADILVYRRGRVQWKPYAARVLRANADDRRIVQDFVYTGRWPVSYRVTTLFGRALMSLRIEADRGRRPLEGRYEFAGGECVVSNSKGCTIVLDADPEIVACAEAAHAAFPETPLLGVDVIREVPSGRCYVLEVNPTGWTWHFSSQSGRRLREELGLDTYGQMGGLERAAEVLAGQALRAAR